MLYSNPGMAFTKQQIYEAVWHEKSKWLFPRRGKHYFSNTQEDKKSIPATRIT
ncbi:MAG: hypothetical protein ACLUVM_01250 [Blautia faecis]